MDVFTVLALLLLAFGAGYVTHWFKSRNLRRQLKEAEAQLEGIQAQLIVRRRGWFK